MGKFSQGRFEMKNPAKYVGLKTPLARSSWEFVFMRMLDEHPGVQNWASESIKIPYRDPLTGRSTIYVPDFLIVYVDANQKQHTELVEVKPSTETTMESARSYRDKLSVAMNMAKWAAADSWARANNMRFRVVTEFDIFKNHKR